jgi:hypothetical protein
LEDFIGSGAGQFTMEGKVCEGVEEVILNIPSGLDRGIGHFRLVEVVSEARAAAPPMPKSL